jgi:aarF domain-containing kinase
MLSGRILLLASSKVVGGSLLYSAMHSNTSRVLRCDSPGYSVSPQQINRVNAIKPLNLSIKSPEDRSMIYRIFRGMLRFGWILLKLVPGVFIAPWALVSARGQQVWWNYTVWVFVSSGPTAIKFAQWVGTRPDIFPDSAVRALSRLHNAGITHYSLEKTVADLDQAYGGSSWRSWLELVDDAKLIGSGAIAHVCRGRITAGPHTGRGVREIVEADLDIMNCFAWMASHVPQFASLDIPGAVDEFGKFIRSQTNLLTEADNINKFRGLFRDKPEIKFPQVFLDYCTRDVLVESFEPGVALGDIIRSGSIKLKKRVCDMGIQAFLKMLFVDNFVHGDLHPGNILFQSSSGATSVAELNKSGSIEGNVLLLDCGLVAQLGPRDERNFVDLMHAVITGKSFEVGRLMIERSRSPPETVYMPDEFCRKVAKLVDTTVTGKSLLFGALEFGTVISELLNIACQHRVRLETDFVSVACALIVLEGVGKQLDPRRNLLWEAEPYILRQFLRRAKERIVS